MDAPLLGEALVYDRQQVPISLCRCIALLAGLVTRMCLEYLVASQRSLHPIAKALQGLDHPALPIDQRAVTVEGECVEIREQHIDFSSFAGSAYARSVAGLQFFPSFSPQSRPVIRLGINEQFDAA